MQDSCIRTANRSIDRIGLAWHRLQAFQHCGRVCSFPRTLVSKISASSDAEENPAVRQALFDEFQRIEWQTRVEAVRERLDEQRLQRQEEEREQEQEAEAQAQEQEREA